MMGKRLTKNEILEVDDLKREIMDIPEWGGEIEIRSCTAAESNDYDDGMSVVLRDEAGNVSVKSNRTNYQARLVVKCVLNVDGSCMFEDKEADGLGKRNAAVIARVFRRIEELSGRTKKAQGDLEKNSGAGQRGSLPSNSPATSTQEA